MEWKLINFFLYRRQTLRSRASSLSAAALARGAAAKRAAIGSIKGIKAGAKGLIKGLGPQILKAALGRLLVKGLGAYYAKFYGEIDEKTKTLAAALNLAATDGECSETTNALGLGKLSVPKTKFRRPRSRIGIINFFFLKCKKNNYLDENFDDQH